MFTILKFNIFKTLVSAATSIAVGGFYGCSSSESGISFIDFRFQVGFHAGSNATNCGTGNSSQSRHQQNICIASAFTNSQGAFAIYRSSGIDSLTATALSVSNSRQVFVYSFDSDPTGGGSVSNGEITRRACINPQLSGTLDSSEFEIFICQN